MINVGSNVQYHTTVERFDSFGGSQGFVKFVSRNIVLATGGRQKLPSTSSLKKFDITKKQRVYTSDEILRESGFKKLVAELRLLNTDKTGGFREPATIVIIGGSHSAFSIAWLLINGPFRPR